MSSPYTSLPGTIILVSGELARYADCLQSIIAVQRPDGTGLVWERSCDIVGNLNRGVNKAKGEWIWIMGDDQAFKPDLLMQLLGRLGPGVDFVAPKVCKRQYPFALVAYDQEVRPGLWRPVLRTDMPKTGLWDVAASTNAGLLIKMDVVRKIGDPLFKNSKDATGYSEDVTFWKEAKGLGFRGFIDVEADLGHITPMTVWPGPSGTKDVHIDVGGGMRLPITFTKEQVLDTNGVLLRETAP